MSVHRKEKAAPPHDTEKKPTILLIQASKSCNLTVIYIN